MNDIQTWDYAASVERVRPMVVSWRSLTVELVDELYRAREALDGRGRTAHGKVEVPNGSFTDYLNEVGLAYRTVHRWLERYVPEERKLLTPEESEQRKAIENRKKQDHKTAVEKRVKVALSTGDRPEDWDDESERVYQAELQRKERTRQAIKEQKEREREWRKADEERKASRQARSEQLDDLLGEATAQIEKRQAFKGRIRLSQSGANDLFIDALMDYLEELPDDNRRIESCQNIIKVCRNIAAELQRNQ
jgi:hypothetical protein